MKLEVIRNSDDGVETLGKMHVLNDQGATVFSCETLERPYKNNEHGISAIPEGVYIVKKVGPSHIPYPHFSIQDVSNRSGVCIHKANYVGQLEGCIAVGTVISDLNKDGENDIGGSKDAFDKLFSIMPDEFQLVIK